MAVVNCTPDSFYPESRAPSPEAAAERALEAEAAGADIVDFGAESTRPGADYVDGAEEIRRLIPALRLFRRRSALPVSVDTRKAAVARAALDEGADLVNDVSALYDDPAMLPLCADRGAAAVLTHGLAEMRLDPAGPGYAGPGGAAEAVRRFLAEAAEKARRGGIRRDRIILDPGIGFGKTTGDNLLLLNRLATIGGGDYPLLVGLSRKRFIGEITGGEKGTPGERLAGTTAAHMAALLLGADIIRVHDTRAAADTVRFAAALRRPDGGEA
jgi:dihydropteroate synthase